MVNYNIYGLSTQGKSSMHNCDNIYINGVYMDSFIFNHYQKNISGSDNIALLIICGGITDNSISKELLSAVRDLSKEKIYTEPLTVVEEISEIVVHLDSKYGADRKRKLDVGIFATGGGNACAISYGNVGMLIGNDGKYTSFCKGSRSNSVGTGSIAHAKLKPTFKKISEKNRVLLYTGPVSAAMKASEITGCLHYNSVKECVDNIEALAGNKYMQNPFSLICMDVETEKTTAYKSKDDDDNNPGRSKRALTAVILLLLSAVIAIAGIAIGMRNNSSEEELSGGVSVLELKNLASQNWKEAKAGYAQLHEEIETNKKTCEEILKSLEAGEYDIVTESGQDTEALEDDIKQFIDVYEDEYIQNYNKLIEAVDEDTVLRRAVDNAVKKLKEKYTGINEKKTALDTKRTEAEEAAKKAEEDKAAKEAAKKAAEAKKAREAAKSKAAPESEAPSKSVTRSHSGGNSGGTNGSTGSPGISSNPSNGGSVSSSKHSSSTANSGLSGRAQFGYE